MAVLGLRFCARAFSSCGKRGPLFITVPGPLTIAASLLVEHRLQTHRLSNCGSWAQLLRGMWDPPRPGLEPVSSALAGRFSTTAPPGKPSCDIFCWTWSFQENFYFLTNRRRVASKGRLLRLLLIIIITKIIITITSDYNDLVAKCFIWIIFFNSY